MRGISPGKDPAVKPRIGITMDMDAGFFKVRYDYAAAVVSSGGIPVMLAPVMEEIDAAAGFIDGLLLPGGADLPPEWYGEELSIPPECFKPARRERIEFESALLKEVMRVELPVMGICLGMQLINVVLGGTLYQDIGLQAVSGGDHRKGHHEINITRPYCPSPSFHSQLIIVNSSHHQAVKTFGKGLEAFAEAGDGIVEGYFARDYPFLVGVQWHPERDIEGRKLPEEGTGPLESPRNRDKLSVAIFDDFIRTARDWKGKKGVI